MIINNHQDYMKAMERHENRSGKIIDGVGYFYVRNELIPDAEYLAHNTKPVYQPMPRENSDKQNMPNECIVKRKRGKI